MIPYSDTFISFTQYHAVHFLPNNKQYLTFTFTFGARNLSHRALMLIQSGLAQFASPMCPQLRSSPAYFKDVCILVADISSRSNLRSAQHGDMVVPQTRTQLGRRSFHVAAPVVWNALPVYLCSTSISREQFRAGLKTRLFNQAYNILCLRVYCTQLLIYLTKVYENLFEVLANCKRVADFTLRSSDLTDVCCKKCK